MDKGKIDLVLNPSAITKIQDGETLTFEYPEATVVVSKGRDDEK
jgi:hypothetical protein